MNAMMTIHALFSACLEIMCAHCIIHKDNRREMPQNFALTGYYSRGGENAAPARQITDLHFMIWLFSMQIHYLRQVFHGR